MRHAHLLVFLGIVAVGSVGVAALERRHVAPVADPGVMGRAVDVVQGAHTGDLNPRAAQLGHAYATADQLLFGMLQAGPAAWPALGDWLKTHPTIPFYTTDRSVVIGGFHQVISTSIKPLRPQ